MDNEAIRELFAGLGEVEIRRLFGGKGIYHRGLIVGLDLFDEIMLKGDQEAAAVFEAAGAKRWVYPAKRSGKPVAMPYWSVPAEVLDDEESLAGWTRMAFAAAVRIEKAKL
ncbi:TfoX/Sxy family protein [Tianweitania sediminis]|uniref:TfoX/Sxy family protein n=1 Tax=Tianweitania sediminis TaxID=1502156 RepID=A0A8J7R6I1_9HYPH|nr:TfoX/Sxy family protein [Tianweitania sediminis]